MLRVTVELLPGGQEFGRRILATAEIARLGRGGLADYRVSLYEVTLGDVCESGVVRQYPRWAGSVWDLASRCIAAALNEGLEELPPRLQQPLVTIHTSETGLPYVRMCEIPEPAQTFFAVSLSGATIPAPGCAYAHDWFKFLDG